MFILRYLLLQETISPTVVKWCIKWCIFVLIFVCLVPNLRSCFVLYVKCRNPRGFGFVQFVDPADAAEAKYHMDGYVLHGRELTVVFAEENRKKPTEMRARERGGVRCMELSLF